MEKILGIRSGKGIDLNYIEKDKMIIISAEKEEPATEERYGLVKINDGVSNKDTGIIVGHHLINNAEFIKPATTEHYGTVKFAIDDEVNSNMNTNNIINIKQLIKKIGSTNYATDSIYGLVKFATNEEVNNKAINDNIIAVNHLKIKEDREGDHTKLNSLGKVKEEDLPKANIVNKGIVKLAKLNGLDIPDNNDPLDGGRAISLNTVKNLTSLMNNENESIKNKIKSLTNVLDNEKGKLIDEKTKSLNEIKDKFLVQIGEIKTKVGEKVANLDAKLLKGQNANYYRCGGCAYTCSSTCTGACMSCASNCSGLCQIECTTTCSTTCTSSCVSCTGNCKGSCTACSGCTNSCTNECTSTCTVGCGNNCKNAAR